MNKQERADLKEIESNFDRFEHLNLSIKARVVLGDIRSRLVHMYLKEDIKRGK